ncbi:MAG: plasmid mobilization protein [Rhodanobacteraceae bacterium]
MPATARVTVLMEPAEKRALEARARREKVSVGELVRRAALASRRDEEDALQAAVTMLHESNASAREALDTALANMAAREKDWPRREREAVEKARALAAEWLAQA